MTFCCPYHVRLSIVFSNKWKSEEVLEKTYLDPGGGYAGFARYV